MLRNRYVLHDYLVPIFVKCMIDFLLYENLCLLCLYYCVEAFGAVSLVTGCLVYLFQISHHPPMSAFYVTNRQDGFSIGGSILTKSKFYGRS